MTTISTTPASPRVRGGHDAVPRLVCAGAALTAIPVFLLMDLPGDSGAAVTRVLVEDATTLQAGGILASLVAAGLLLAAVRLGQVVGGSHRALVTAAGSAVAVLYGAYYASFAAGALVADYLLADPGPGVGEGALLLVNLTEITRYAPGLVLVGACVAARRALPRTAWIPALVLVVLSVVPFTTWVAALLIPVWLGVTAAALPRRAPAAV
jgi:hypothetical protein